MQKGRIRMVNPLEWVERAADQLREAPLTQEIIRASFGLSFLTPIQRIVSSPRPQRC